jgi:hypothetical protein
MQCVNLVQIPTKKPSSTQRKKAKDRNNISFNGYELVSKFIILMLVLIFQANEKYD